MTAPIAIIPVTDDWRILPVILNHTKLWALEFREPARLAWVEMYLAATEAECEAAYDAYQEGEQPEGGEWWP